MKLRLCFCVNSFTSLLFLFWIPNRVVSAETSYKLRASSSEQYEPDSLFASGEVGRPIKKTVPTAVLGPLESYFINWIKTKPNSHLRLCDNVDITLLPHNHGTGSAVHIEALLQPLGLICVIADLLSGGTMGPYLENGLLGLQLVGPTSIFAEAVTEDSLSDGSILPPPPSSDSTASQDSIYGAADGNNVYDADQFVVDLKSLIDRKRALKNSFPHLFVPKLYDTATAPASSRQLRRLDELMNSTLISGTPPGGVGEVDKAGLTGEVLRLVEASSLRVLAGLLGLSEADAGKNRILSVLHERLDLTNKAADRAPEDVEGVSLEGLVSSIAPPSTQTGPSGSNQITEIVPVLYDEWSDGTLKFFQKVLAVEQTSYDGINEVIGTRLEQTRDRKGLQRDSAVLKQMLEGEGLKSSNGDVVIEFLVLGGATEAEKNSPRSIDSAIAQEEGGTDSLLGSTAAALTDYIHRTADDLIALGSLDDRDNSAEIDGSLWGQRSYEQALVDGLRQPMVGGLNLPVGFNCLLPDGRYVPPSNWERPDFHKPRTAKAMTSLSQGFADKLWSSVSVLFGLLGGKKGYIPFSGIGDIAQAYLGSRIV